MSRKNIRYIPEPVRMQLWGQAAGRCEFDGCNKILWKDDLTKAEFNTSYIAHIIADSPDGPRGDLVKSELLKKDITNLMLMCDTHHRMIDRDVQTYTIEKLQSMKKAHESRMEIITCIQAERISQIVIFGANIGEQNGLINEKQAKIAIIPDWYPTQSTINLGMINSSSVDYDRAYWESETKNLEHQYYMKVKERLDLREIDHLSIFGLAPQPLLVKFGALITDIPQAQIYQLHREPQTWRWKQDDAYDEFIIKEPNSKEETVVLKISLSAKISDERVTSAIKGNVSIWELTVKEPNYDVITCKAALSDLRQTIRRLYARIKEVHGQNCILNVFPAMPVSAAIEFGRVRNTKADVKLIIYDQNRYSNIFEKAIIIE